MCDDLSFFNAYPKHFKTFQKKKVLIPRVDEKKLNTLESQLKGNPPPSSTQCYVRKDTDVQKNIFCFLSDFVSPHLVLNDRKHFCSILTGIIQYLQDSA